MNEFLWGGLISRFVQDKGQQSWMDFRYGDFQSQWHVYLTVTLTKEASPKIDEIVLCLWRIRITDQVMSLSFCKCQMLITQYNATQLSQFL